MMAEKVNFNPTGKAWAMQATAQQIDQCSGIGKGVNLFDNPFFQVNQRGETTWEVVNGRKVYHLDQWWNYDAGSYQFTNPGLKCTKGLGHVIQNIRPDLDSFLLNKLVTISLAYLEAEALKLIHLTITWNPRINYADKIGMKYDPNFGGSYVEFRFIPEGSTLVAAKLELGTQQTLAVQNSSGQWVLADPIPDYTLELLKCRWYGVFSKESLDGVYGRIEEGANLAKLIIPLSAAIRGNSVVKIPQAYILGNGNVVEVTNVNTTGLSYPYGVLFYVSGNFSSIGQFQTITCSLPQGISIDAEL